MVSIKPLSVTYYKEMINGPWCMEVLLEYNKSALGAIHYFVSFERVLTNIIPGRSYSQLRKSSVTQKRGHLL